MAEMTILNNIDKSCDVESKNDINEENENKDDSDSDSDSIMNYIENYIDNSENKNDDEYTDTIIIPGIDLGTTTSCIGIWRNGNCEIIPDEFGNKTIPSYVSYTNLSKYVG